MQYSVTGTTGLITESEKEKAKADAAREIYRELLRYIESKRENGAKE